MNTVRFPFENSYGRLPARFYTRLAPTVVTDSGPVIVNAGVARSLVRAKTIHVRSKER